MSDIVTSTAPSLMRITLLNGIDYRRRGPRSKLFERIGGLVQLAQSPDHALGLRTPEGSPADAIRRMEAEIAEEKAKW